MYGHLSGNALQEFRVTKFNRKGKPQERLLCIDGFYIHNREYKKGDKIVNGGSSVSNNNAGGGG